MKNMTEKEMRECKVPWFDKKRDLIKYISQLVNMKHDYGTCCYAMSMSAVAAFNFVSSKLGVTGFQASCAELDVLARTRNMKLGFKILDNEDLLYPQMKYKFGEEMWERMTRDNIKVLREKAKELINENKEAHPVVMTRWIYLANTKEEDERSKTK